MSVSRKTFQNADGLTLHGWLHAPPIGARGTVLFAHCFTCTAKSFAAVTISQALASAGFRVLRFDFTGLGDSAGDFQDTNFSSSVADLLAAASFLADNGTPVDMMIGHSLGGTAVLQAAAYLPQCRAVVTIGAPARAEHVAHLVGAQYDQIERTGVATVNIGGRPFAVKRQFLKDLEEQPAPERLRELRVALLVMHAPLDNIVEIANASEIFVNAIHPKSFISLDDADHLLTRRRDAAYAAALIATWCRRYMENGEELLTAPADDWITASTPQAGFQTVVTGKGHSLTADEPENVGGTNIGPSPYDLLSAALASCTSMTLQMYARHKGIALSSATAHVRHSRIHAEDCEDCANKQSRIDQFERDLELIGEIDQATRERLIEIADRCPVHRTLTSQVRIVTAERPR